MGEVRMLPSFLDQRMCLDLKERRCFLYYLPLHLSTIVLTASPTPDAWSYLFSGLASAVFTQIAVPFFWRVNICWYFVCVLLLLEKSYSKFFPTVPTILQHLLVSHPILVSYVLSSTYILSQVCGVGCGEEYFLL